ncbi:MAG TPA: hypothetical protein VFA04_02065 [Bryobacteraceae bacterium]|nr:hypothetical protein [Bryobacteraceae bacterium]
MPRRVTIAVGFALLLALVAVPLWLCRDQPLLGDNYDDAVYWSSARSLATGSGYRVPTLPGDPWQVKYPPLYPLYLSLAWRADPQFPHNLPLATALQAVLLPLAAVLLLLALRTVGCGRAKSFLLTALMLGSISFALSGVILFSEPLFLCLFLGSIVAMERAMASPGPASRWWAIAGGILAGAAYLTRTAGLPLLVAAPLWCILRRRYDAAMRFLLMALPAGAAWHYWAALHVKASDGGYLREYLTLIATNGFIGNLLIQLGALSAAVAGNLVSGVMNILGGTPLQHVFLIAATAGCIRLGRRRGWPLYLVVTALYIPMLVLWTYHNLDRLILPVWPVLLAGIAEEAEHCARLMATGIARHRPRLAPAPRWLFAAAAMVVLIWNVQAGWSELSAVVSLRRAQRPKQLEAFSWIRSHAHSGDVLLAWKDGLSSMYTGVPASRAAFSALMPRSAEDKALGEPLSAMPPQYDRALLLLFASDLEGADERTRLNSLKALAARVAGARQEYASGAALVYSVPRPVSPAGAVLRSGLTRP